MIGLHPLVGRFCRVAAAATLVYWLQASAAGAAAPQTCGDEACDFPETCQNCPQDCYSQCVCGDSVCDDGAEGGGECSGCFDKCSESALQNGTCLYCSQDCGECDDNICKPKVCNNNTGYCKDCIADQDCWVFPDQPQCDIGSGDCVACNTNEDCNEIYPEARECVANSCYLVYCSDDCDCMEELSTNDAYCDAGVCAQGEGWCPIR